MKALKNRKTVLLLLVVVLGIWGGIVYQVVEYSRRESVGLPASRPGKRMTPDTGDSLLLNYRDPFLGDIPRKMAASGIPPSKVKEKNETEEPPPFRFAGQIKKGKQSSLLIISAGETRLISVRTKAIEGYRIERIYSDSLLVSRGKLKYMLRIDR